MCVKRLVCRVFIFLLLITSPKLPNIDCVVSGHAKIKADDTPRNVQWRADQHVLLRYVVLAQKTMHGNAVGKNDSQPQLMRLLMCERLTTCLEIVGDAPIKTNNGVLWLTHSGAPGHRRLPLLLFLLEEFLAMAA